MFLCYYCCSINLQKQSEHSGLRPDTSSLVYICRQLISHKFLWYSDKCSYSYISYDFSVTYFKNVFRQLPIVTLVWWHIGRERREWTERNEESEQRSPGTDQRSFFNYLPASSSNFSTSCFLVGENMNVNHSFHKQLKNQAFKFT